MQTLTKQRCYNHARREAAVRCPGCHKYFCRECVSEHEEQLLCILCLQKQRTSPATLKERLRPLRLLFRTALTFVLLWLAFYSLGKGLLLLPHAFHEPVSYESTP